MKTGKQIADRRVAQAFNEWMRRYTEEPDRFSREWQAVATFLEEQAAGKTPSYGERCAAYLATILETIPFEADDNCGCLVGPCEHSPAAGV